MSRESDRSEWGQAEDMANKESMKAQVKQAVSRQRYDVTRYYKSEGLFQACARSMVFQNLTLAAILTNALWVAIDTDLNEAEVLVEAAPVFQILDHSFCTYFSLELFIRFMSFRRKRDISKDLWFFFDSVLLALMIAETWVLTVVVVVSGGSEHTMKNPHILRTARLLRLTRMARVARVLRVMPELLVLIKGMVAATRSVFFTLCLLAILLYVFGIALRQLTEGTEAGEAYFPTVPESMYKLLIHATFLDHLGYFVEDVGKDSTVCVVLIWVFVLLGPLTMLNMLIGVLCEVVSAVAASEKEANVVKFTTEKMARLFAALDASGDGLISREEFFSLVQKPETARLLTEVGVDVVGLIDEADAIFSETFVGEDGEQAERQLTFEDLMEVVLELRGSSHVSVKHIVQLRKHVLAAVAQTNKNLMRLEGAFLSSEVARPATRRHTRMHRAATTDMTKADTVGDEPREVPHATLVKFARESLEVPEERLPADDDAPAAAAGSVPAGLWEERRPSGTPAAPTSHAVGPGPSMPGDDPPLSLGLAPAAPDPAPDPAPDLPGPDLQTLLERVEDIVREARAEIRRELGRSVDPAQERSAPPLAAAAGVLSAREWCELRAKIAGIAELVPSPAELRCICAAPLEEDEEPPDQLLEPRKCRLLSQGAARA